MTLKWLWHLLHALRDPRGYIFLSVPFQRRQHIYSRTSGILLRYAVRERADYRVLSQVYGARDYDTSRLARGADIAAAYEAIVVSGRTPLIVDCGANIGASANFFAENYPLAQITAIEPEPGNFAALQRHCPKPQITCINAAISGRARFARIVDPGHGAWGFQVESSEDGEGGVICITFNELLADARLKDAVPFIAKIDIEGSESDLFATCAEWLDRFPLVIIELHDWLFPRQANSRAFLKAVAGLDRDFVYQGENIFSISNGPAKEDRPRPNLAPDRVHVR